MGKKDIVVIGASVGGFEAVKQIVTELPPGLNASIFVVVHISGGSAGILPQMLQTSGRLPASNAIDGEVIKPSHIYVAPPDRHLVLDGAGLIRLSKSPKENFFRPAIDPLFRSAALAFGSRVIGIILTGRLDDGASGLWAVKRRGGVAIVQDPKEAVAPSMPLSALKQVDVDHRVSLKEIASLIVNLSGTSAEEKGTSVATNLETDVRIARGENPLESGWREWGSPSIISCPECHGNLLTHKEGELQRFRCHTGHGYSAESLLDKLRERTEEALWNAMRALQEQAQLMRSLAENRDAKTDSAAPLSLAQEAEKSQQLARVIQQSLLKQQTWEQVANGELR
jgi:two-component system, chemotaxis family, protein-glutamate methylesterase/glutaminase